MKMAKGNRMWALGATISGVTALLGFWVSASDARAHPATWTTAGPEGKQVSALAVHGRILYAGGGGFGSITGVGVLRSTDRGYKWRVISKGLANRGVRSLLIDPGDPSTVYAAIDYDGVYKSVDGGDTWRPMSSGLSAGGANPSVTCLIFDPHDSKTLYAGVFFASPTYSAIFKSNDGGASWVAASDTFMTWMVMDLVVDPRVPTTLYAATFGQRRGWRSGVFKSIDAGASWIETSSGLPVNVREAQAFHPPLSSVVIDPVDASTLYVGTAEYGVFKSTDGGGQWRAVNAGFPLLPALPYFPEVRSLAIDPRNGSLYAGLIPFGLFKSLDGGQHWVPLNYGSAVTHLRLDPTDPATLYVVGPHGIFRSTDGGNRWNEANQGIVTSYAVALVADPNDAGTVYAGTDNLFAVIDTEQGDGRWRPSSASGRGVFKSGDRGRNWAVSGLPDRRIAALAVDPQRRGTLYTAFGAHLFKSLDAGDSWNEVSWSYQADIQSIAVDGRNSILYVGTTGFGVYKSADGGHSWEALNDGLGRGEYASSLAIDPSNAATIYVGSAAGGVYKTTDGGGRWIEISEGLREYSGPFAYPLQISTVVIDPRTPTTLYAGVYYTGEHTNPPGGLDKTTGGVYKSTNGGANWSPVYSGLDEWRSLNVNDVVIDPRSPTTLYAGTDGGIFKSTDAGARWRPVNAGLMDLPVQTLAIDPKMPGAIYAGTIYGGVFVLSPALLREEEAAPRDRTAVPVTSRVHPGCVGNAAE